MALKDWKKIMAPNLFFANDIYNWKHKTQNKKINFGKEHGEYYVLIVDGVKQNTKKFTNKQKALAYAKAYMRIYKYGN